MTISSAICRNDYTGTGATATYPYAFRILQSSDLLVIQTDTSGVETTLVLGTDYSVTGVGSYSGGNVVLSANLASGYGLAIKRVIPLTQPTSIRNQASFLPSVHEDVFDRLTMIDQQQQDAIDRSLSLPEGSVGIDASIPALIPNYSLVANAAGDGFDFAPNTAADQLADLADTTDSAKGSGRIGFNYALSYAAGTIGAWLKGLAAGTGASLLGYLSPLTGAVVRTLAQVINDLPVSPKWFGAVGDGTTDDTAAIRAAFAASNRVFFPRGDYSITLGTSGPSLVVLTSQSNIVIRGDGARLMDQTVYLNNDPKIAMFELSGCSNFDIDGVEYVGQTLVSPSTDLGYVGATFVDAHTGSTNIRVRAKLSNMRYGVRSGDYSDTTRGSCSHFMLDLVTSFVGYPIATYLADDVNANIYADSVHRAAYVAGCRGGELNVRWKNQYIANIAVIATDALVSTGVSRGCSGMRIYSQDLGSTVFQASSTACGLSMQRCDPGTTFEDLDFRFVVQSSDTLSTKVGGFQLISGAQANGYPFNWESTIYLNNIRVGGVIDRNGQTLDSNSAGDIYAIAHQSGHMATVRNLVVRDMVIIPSSGTTRSCYIEVPGTQNPVVLDGVNAPSVNFQLYGGATYPFHLKGSQIGNIVSGGTTLVSMADASVSSVVDGMTAQSCINSTVAGGYGKVKMKQISLTLSGASVNWSNALPAGCVCLGVAGRLTTSITGATGYQVGVSGAATRFADHTATAAGDTFTPADQLAGENYPRNYLATSNIVVTAKTSNFTAGVLKLQLWYVDFSAPTA